MSTMYTPCSCFSTQTAFIVEWLTTGRLRVREDHLLSTVSLYNTFHFVFSGWAACSVLPHRISTSLSPTATSRSLCLYVSLPLACIFSVFIKLCLCMHMHSCVFFIVYACMYSIEGIWLYGVHAYYPTPSVSPGSVCFVMARRSLLLLLCTNLLLLLNFYTVGKHTISDALWLSKQVEFFPLNLNSGISHSGLLCARLSLLKSKRTFYPDIHFSVE